MMSPVEALIWLLVIYFLPSIVAYARRSTWRSTALFANLFFGWLVVGWILGWFFAFHRREGPHRHYRTAAR